jgi:GTP-binding protein HflX
VELAQLNYMLPRLTGRWRHLGRQAGGIGVRGGEGEKQIEADRRMLRRRISRLEKDLQKIERTRETQRRGRRGARTADLLFATLDARLRRGTLDGVGTVLFTDTVGFIRKLPHHLVSSFRSTLGEIAESDLVLHVIDRSHPRWSEQMELAEEVLRSLGVEPGRMIRVFNKSDLFSGESPTAAAGDGAISISALTGSGQEELAAEIARRLERLREAGAPPPNGLPDPEMRAVVPPWEAS